MQCKDALLGLHFLRSGDERRLGRQSGRGDKKRNNENLTDGYFHKLDY